MKLRKTDPWPPAILIFFDRLRPSQTSVPLVDLKTIVASETGFALNTQQVRTLLHRRRFDVKDGHAYVE